MHTSKYEEELHFILIRFKEPHYTPVASQLRALLQRAGVGHACEYTIFGHWDGLVRVWLTPASRLRLGAMLESPEANVDRHLALQAQQIHYLWSDSADEDLARQPDRALLARIAARSDVIASVVRDGLDSANGALPELKRAGLVFQRPSAPASAVKFYMILEPAGEFLPRPQQVKLVLDALADTGMASRASLYAGSGTLGPYLIRCVADSYRDVLRDTAALDRFLPHSRLRAMTLLVANDDAIESDNVNDPAVLSRSAEGTARLLGLTDTGRAMLGSLPDADQIAFAKLVERAFQASEGSPAQAVLEPMLKASVEGDQGAFKAQLPFVLDMEYHFGTYLKRAFGDVFGANWTAVVPEELAEGDAEAKRAAQETRRPVNEWTLGTYVHAARQTAKINAMFANRLDRHLGPSWSERLGVLLKIRNDFSHGRFATPQDLQDFSGSFGALLDDLIEVCVFAYRCSERNTDETQDK